MSGRHVDGETCCFSEEALPSSVHSIQMQGQIVTQVLRQRIGERIGSLKISWRQASIDAGLGSGFIQDLITGRAKDPPEAAHRPFADAKRTSLRRLRSEIRSRLRLSHPRTRCSGIASHVP